MKKSQAGLFFFNFTLSRSGVSLKKRLGLTSPREVVSGLFNVLEGIYMLKLMAWIRTQDGATAIEYGLIAAGIAVAISAVVFTFGGDLAAMFDDMSTTISTAGPQ